MSNWLKLTGKFLTVIYLTSLIVACGGGAATNSSTTSTGTSGADTNTNTSTTEVTTNGNGSVTLSWLPPTENTDGTSLTDLDSYKIYYGTSPDVLDSSIVLNNPGLTSYVIEQLDANTTYYFTITALNTDQVESSQSNKANKNITI